MLNFKKTRRKPSPVDLAKVDAKTARELLKNGYKGKKVSFSEEDKEMVLKAKDDEIVGFVGSGSDGESYWFINYDYAVKNYEVE